MGEPTTWEREVTVARSAVRDAAAAITRYYDLANAGVYEKQDRTPLTDADLASDQLLRNAVERAFPKDALLTEEGADNLARLDAPRVWIADPLDGTKQFVERTGEFDVFLALVVDGRPVVGAVVHPLSGQLIWAVEGQGAWVEQDGESQRLHFSPVPDGNRPRVATSHYHGAPATLPLLTRVAERSGMERPVSLPIGFQARAFIDPSIKQPRYELFVGVGQDIDGPNHSGGEWDFAAGDLIVREAGGAYTDLRGRRFVYNKSDTRNFGGLVAATDPTVHARFLATISTELR